jgi:hypothetical protein
VAQEQIHRRPANRGRVSPASRTITICHSGRSRASGSRQARRQRVADPDEVSSQVLGTDDHDESFSRARKATPMAINAVLAVIPVGQFDTACDWYASFFGRPADQRPMDSLAEWHLIDAGIVQVFHDPGKAGRTTVNFLVDDLDERVGRLTATDIATADPLVVASGRQRLVTCTETNSASSRPPDPQPEGASAAACRGAPWILRDPG